MTGQFRQVVEDVVTRLAELLCSQVAVLNSQGIIVASNYPDSQGMRFEQLSTTFGTSYRRLPIHLAGQIGELIVAESPKGERISSRLLQGLVELVINQVAAGQLLNQHELKNKFIYDLLRGCIFNEIDILRDAQILGMDLTRPRAVILIDAADYILKPIARRPFVTDAQIWQRAEFVIRSIVSFFHLPNDTICAYIGEGEVAVLKASSSQDLAAWTTQEDEQNFLNSSWANLAALKRAGNALLTRLHYDTHASISIGIGRYHPTIQGLAQSYEDARVALSLGRRFHGPNQTHCLDQLGIAAFVGVSDEATKVELAKHLLSPLDQEPELLETLEIFFRENCCPSAIAKRLSIHRNTLSYRLEKITSLTGLDPRQFDDAMQIRLALILRSLRAEAASGPKHLSLSREGEELSIEELEEWSSGSARVAHSGPSSVQP